MPLCMTLFALLTGGRVQTVSCGKERPFDPVSNEQSWAVNRCARTLLIDALVHGG